MTWYSICLGKKVTNMRPIHVWSSKTSVGCGCTHFSYCYYNIHRLKCCCMVSVENSLCWLTSWCVVEFLHFHNSLLIFFNSSFNLTSNKEVCSFLHESLGLLLEELSNKPVKPETLEELNSLEESKQKPTSHHTEFSEIGYWWRKN
jgi:hypothetical protein